MAGSPRRVIASAVVVVTAAAPVAAQDASSGIAKGVNPKDNISKVELLYKYDDLDLEQGTHSLTAKYDKALSSNWAFNVEVPLVTYHGFGRDDAGLGDVQARLRYVTTLCRWSLLGGAELVAPTASQDTLGRGMWQANPVFGAVYAFSQTTFAFAGYKHLFSFAGESDRADINESQPRLLLAYTAPQGWWMLGDAKYTKSWECTRTSSGCDRLETLDTEIELGQMMSRSTGVWIRAGTSFLDSSRDFGLNIGIRNIF